MATALKIAFALGVLGLGLVPLLVILERRLSAFMQGRVGPNRVGPAGLLQPLADVIKFLLKEDVIPLGADRFLYVCAPLLVFIPPALGMCIIPFGSRIGDEPLQAVHLGIGILFVMSVLSVGVYGLAFGGWASNSKYSLLGGLRASAQLISYELTLGLSIITVVMFTAVGLPHGTLDPAEMVSRQARAGWNVFGGGNLALLPAGLLGILLFFIAALAENNRLPFDLSECEAELVGGYHTEYSSMKFALFFMGEYVAMVLMSALLVTFWLGGWSLPPMWGALAGANEWLASGGWLPGLVSVGVFMGKVFVLLLVYIALRWTLPRFKYDQLMDLGWKRLIPLSLANVAYVAVVGVLTS